MTPRQFLLLFIFALVATGYSANTFVSTLKSNIVPGVGFAYLNNNKLVSFRPINELNELKNGQLYVIFPVYFFQGYVKNPEQTTLKIKITFTNGTVKTEDLTPCSLHRYPVFKY